MHIELVKSVEIQTSNRNTGWWWFNIYNTKMKTMFGHQSVAAEDMRKWPKQSGVSICVRWRWILHCNHNRKVWSSREKVNTAALSIDPQIRIKVAGPQPHEWQENTCCLSAKRGGREGGDKWQLSKWPPLPTSAQPEWLCELLSMETFKIIRWRDFNRRIWFSTIVLTPTIFHPSPCYSSDSLSYS